MGFRGWVWLLYFAGLYLTPSVWTKENGACPSGCYCVERKSDLVPEGVGLKINCHPLSSGQLNFSLLPANTIHLDLARYGLRTLTPDMFASAPYLQKLDLQNNEISRIEDGAFRTLEHLELLDLTRNVLESVSRNTFYGLKKLERLKLNDNRLRTIEEGSFDDLTSLSKLELSDNTLVCNCSLTWLLDWLSQRQSVLGNPTKTKCSLPIELAEVPLRKANKEDFRCTADTTKTPSKSVGLFQLEPTEHQVVFEDDTLKLNCRAQVSALQKVTWLVKGRPVDGSDLENIHLATNLLPGDIVEATVTIHKVKAPYSGDWTCIIGSQDDTPQKASTPLQKSVNVLVITSETKLCSPAVAETPRGTYRWGVAVGGHTVQQACQRNRQQRGFGFAYYLCRQTGEWAASVNTSQCAYTSTVTETLHKFASMNTSFDTGTLLESAKYFLNYTGNPEQFQDPLDVVYFSKAVENYLPYLKRNTDVGHYMMDMISNTLAIRPDLMGRAQRRGQAAKLLLNIIENITSIVPTFQHHDEELAVEGRPLKPVHFEGLSCAWYSTTSVNEYQRLKRVFHCTQGNKTAPSQGKKILANVVLPNTLYQQLSAQGLLLPVTTINPAMTFAAFDNASLFPSLSDSSDYEPVNSPVIGGLISGLPVFNLTNPVRVILRYSDGLDDTDAASVIQPMWWNPSGNGGSGSWTPDFCKLINAKSNLIQFTCSRLGYFGYRVTRDAFDFKSSGSGFRLHHPVTYASSAICIGVLVLSTLVYISCHASIRISRKLKHALPNVWASMAMLCFLYVAGIHQTQHQVICRSIGFTTHYLTLSTLLWLVVCTHIIYKKVTKQRKQTIRSALGEHSTRAKLRRPVTRFYLFGWGVGIIVVAITASINVEYYTTSRHCFMKLAPFLGAVVVPAAILLSLMLGFALSAYCVLSTAPSHVTEQIEVDLFRHGRSGLVRESGSLLSVSTMPTPDDERSSKSLLHSQGLLLGLYVISWSMGALAVSRTSTVAQTFPLEDLFSIFFSLASSTLSIFVFIYFCVLRRDVRRCWRQPVCLSRSRHQAFREEEDDQMEETTNLVNIFPNPALVGQSSIDGPKYNFANNFNSNTFSDNLPPPHGLNFGGGPDHFSIQESCGPSNASVQQRVVRGAVVQSSKEVSLTRKDSDDVSSDHLSINNLNHLRRGYVAPVNSGCVSEADYTMLPNPSLFGPSSKMNTSNMHSNHSSVQGKQLGSLQPHTSSPAGIGLPQFIDLSPLVAVDSQGQNNASIEPYSVMSLGSKRDDNLLDSNLDNGYTESCTIKMGQPCQLASLTVADFPSQMAPSSASARQVPRFPLPLSIGGSKSASMPRRHHYHHTRHKNKKTAQNASSDHEETKSKHSVGSSTCYSSKSNQQRRKRKPPNRRKPKTKDEPYYNNVSNRCDDSLEENYMGDDDQFDSLERRIRRGHSSAPASSEDQLSEAILDSDEKSKDLLKTSSQIQDLLAADLLKRETSV